MICRVPGLGLGLIDLAVCIDGPDVFWRCTGGERTDHSGQHAPQEERFRFRAKYRPESIARRLCGTWIDWRNEPVITWVKLVSCAAHVAQGAHACL